MKNLFLIIVTSLLALSCKTKDTQPETNRQSDIAVKSTVAAQPVSALAAKQDSSLHLMVSLCFACHNPDHGTTPRLAPPMYKVREHYYTNEITKEEFISRVTSYALNPTLEASIMPGAVRNFGLMPKSAFKEEDVRKIAAYIYDHDLGAASWKEEWKTFQSQQDK